MSRLLKKVVKRTPAGECDTFYGKKRGTLKRGWTTKSEKQAESSNISVDKFIDAIEVQKQGSKYLIKIANPVHYASYAEYGHRTLGGKELVNGNFMLTIAENEIGQQVEAIINKKLQKELRILFQ